MDSQTFLYRYRKKEVNVTLEFPESSDREAELEFFDRLKEIYLRSIRTIYVDNPVCSSLITKDREERKYE